VITEGKLFDMLQAINWSYGRGDFIGYDPATERATFQCTSCAPETRKYAIIGDKVRFCGHTRKFNKETYEENNQRCASGGYGQSPKQ
jgi:hypothetical protein